MLVAKYLEDVNANAAVNTFCLKMYVCTLLNGMPYSRERKVFVFLNVIYSRVGHHNNTWLFSMPSSTHTLGREIQQNVTNTETQIYEYVYSYIHLLTGFIRDCVYLTITDK